MKIKWIRPMPSAGFSSMRLEGNISEVPGGYMCGDRFIPVSAVAEVALEPDPPPKPEPVPHLSSPLEAAGLRRRKK